MKSSTKPSAEGRNYLQDIQDLFTVLDSNSKVFTNTSYFASLRRAGENTYCHTGRLSTIARQILTAVMSLTLLLVAGACGGSKHMAVQVEGHYTYQHGWSYDIAEGHIDVHETGTMDFYHDGTALDSARQNYSITLKDGGSILLVFNYISPSRWRTECEDFYFAGIAETFRMTLIDVTTVRCENTLATDLARRIILNVGKGIARETKFHLDKLTPQELVWSYTYSDGHTDTWEFYRSGK